MTTQDLLLRLGTTSHLRSARADVLFRRLRLEKHDQIAEALMRAPRRLDASVLDEPTPEQPRKKRRMVEKKA